MHRRSIIDKNKLNKIWRTLVQEHTELTLCTSASNPKHLSVELLKATVSGHHLAEVNGPTQAVDLLIFYMSWVTGWHTLTLSQSFPLSLSVNVSLSLCVWERERLQRIPGREDIHSHATPTNDIWYKWQWWQFWHSLNNMHVANIYEYEQIYYTMEVSSVYMNTLLLHHK